MGWNTDAAGNYTYVGDRGDGYDYGNSRGSNDPYAKPMFGSQNTNLYNGSGTANNMGQPQSIFGQRNDNGFFQNMGIQNTPYDNLTGKNQYRLGEMGIDENMYGGYNSGEIEGIKNSLVQNPMSLTDEKSYLNNQKMKMNQQDIDAANAFDWGGAINTGMGVANTAMNIGSYFQNQKFNKERLGALKDNRQYAAAANQRKTNFHNAANSVFA